MKTARFSLHAPQARFTEIPGFRFMKTAGFRFLRHGRASGLQSRRFVFLLFRRSTGHDLGDLAGDGALAGTVVLEGQAVDHLGGVLGGAVHGVLT